MEGKGEEGRGSAWPTTCGPFYVRVRQRRLDTLATTCGPLLADPGRARAPGCTFKGLSYPGAPQKSRRNPWRIRIILGFATLAWLTRRQGRRGRRPLLKGGRRPWQRSREVASLGRPPGQKDGVHCPAPSTLRVGPKGWSRCF